MHLNKYNNHYHPRDQAHINKIYDIYTQNLFPQYKLICKNTHALKRCIHQQMPYASRRGGLLTLIHNKYAFPGNITKIPTPINISPYLQIIRINNQSLQPWSIIHIYMPKHVEDIRLIPNIKITSLVKSMYTHITYTSCGEILTETLYLLVDK